MATVTAKKTARKIEQPGFVSFWTARRTPRQTVIDALDAVGEATVPPVDEYDSLLTAGQSIIDASGLNSRKTPVRADSLSRTGIGVEFVMTHKGDSENSREFLFSLGVDKGTNRARFIKKGVHPAFATLFAHPNADGQIDSMYQFNLGWMPSRDVTDSLVGMLSRNRAVRLKPNGGVYFVPECSADKVDAVFQILNQHGSRCILLQQDLSNDPEFRKQILDSTNEDIVEGLAEMQAEMEEILADPKKKPRSNGLESKMKAIARYHDLLEYYQKTFGVGLTAAQASMTTAMDLLFELQVRYKS